MDTKINSVIICYGKNPTGNGTVLFPVSYTQIPTICMSFNEVSYGNFFWPNFLSSFDCLTTSFMMWSNNTWPKHWIAIGY